jgi:hypothetical protein
MKKREIEKIIKKHILPHIEGFEVQGDLLYVTPMNDLISGYCFENTGWDHIYLWQFVQPLYIPEDGIFFSYGDRLRSKLTNYEAYELDQPNVKSSCDQIVELITENQNYIKQFRTAQDFYRHFRKNPSHVNKYDIRLTQCYLKSGCYKWRLKRLIEFYEKEGLVQDHERIRYAKHLLDNIHRSDEVFAEWKAYTIKELRLKL